MTQPLLFADRGCPFAHRVRALLEHLGVAYRLEEAPTGALPEGLARHSPSGRIPLLVDGELTVSESRVMLEHLAESYHWRDAYPGELAPRTRHRHAMALVDVYIAPTFARGDAALDSLRLAECLDVLEEVALVAPTAPSLLAFHLAPLWLCFRTWRPERAFTRGVRDRPALAAWLDRAASLPPVATTALR